jgi:hypothetical protein
MNNIIVRVTNASGSIFDFTPQNLDLRVDVSAIENGNIGEIFGIASNEFVLESTAQVVEDTTTSPPSYYQLGNKVSDFFGTLDYAGSVATNPIISYYPCQILNNGATIFEGQIYFKSIVTSNDGYSQYNVGIVNNTISLKTQLEQLNLQFLDWSKYNHNFTYDSITGSWDNTISNGDVKYPHVNYGIDPADNTAPQYAFSGWNISTTNTFDSYTKPLRIWEFKPAIKAKAVVDTIFSGSNFTYTSSFFSSSYFNNLYILPSTNNQLGPAAANPVSQSIWAYASASTVPPIAVGSEELLNLDTYYFNNSTGYDLGTDVFTAPVNGLYNITANVVFFIENWAPYLSGISHHVDLNIYKNGSLQPIATNRQYQPQATSSISLNTSLNLDATDYLEFKLGFSGPVASTQYISASGNSVNYNPAGVPNVNSGAYTTYIRVDSSAIASGYNVNMGAQFPKDMTGYDIIKGLIDKFNLIIEPIDGGKVFRIEPYQDWVDQGSKIDWSNRVDLDTKFELVHPASEQPKTLIFTDEDDVDFYNKDAKSKNRFGYNFGTYVFDFDGDIAQSGEKKIGKTFASTPISAIPNSTNFIIPHLCDINDNKVSTPIQFKPRLLYDNGKRLVPQDALGIDQNLNINRGKYWFRNDLGTPVSQSYWYQMTPLTSTPVDFNNGQDLHFGNLKWSPYIQLYSNGQTPNDAYSKYWGSYINTLYDEDARKLTCNVYLKPMDIANLRLNSQYFIMGNYWRINKIINANLSRPQNTQVELIKVPARTTVYPQRRITPGTGPSNPSFLRARTFLNSGYVQYEDVTGNLVSNYNDLLLPASKDGFSIAPSGSTGANVIWNIEQNTAPQSQNQQQTILGVNIVDPIASRVNVVGAQNDIKGATDNISISGNKNIIAETSNNITIIGSNDNSTDSGGINNLIIAGGEGNEIKTTVSNDYDSQLRTNDVVLLNVSGSLIDSSYKTNFIGRFNYSLNLAPNNLADVYTSYQTLPEYYGMNVMASTGLEEAYWFNRYPYSIESTGTSTVNLNNQNGRNKYLFWSNQLTSGTTTINLDDMDGAGNNFPAIGRALMFWADEGIDPCSPVVINRGGSDLFYPANGSSGNNTLTLDEPHQVAEIHATLDPGGQGQQKIIRKSNEQRRNSFLQAIQIEDVTVGEEGGTCVYIDWTDTVEFNYNISIDGDRILIKYPGIYKFDFSGTGIAKGVSNSDLALTLYKNGNIIPYSTYTAHFNHKDEYHTLSHSWLVKVDKNDIECNNGYFNISFYSSDPATILEAGANEGCTQWPAAAINIHYVGGGYGIDDLTF